MVRIRLMRVGKKKQPSYRVVVADSRSPRDGRIIEAIGHYQPRREPSVIEIDSDRAVHWLRRGAQPSDTVRKLLQVSGAWAEFTGETPPVAGTHRRASAVPTATPAASVAETPLHEPQMSDATAEASEPPDDETVP
jgi:small subunit ribosomal protein S16